MNNSLIKQYIDDQPVKVVTKLDLDTGKLVYDKIVQCQNVLMPNRKNCAVHIC